MDIIFLTKEQVLEIHQDQLAHYGGLDGIRDEGGVESALDAPKNWLAFSGCEPDDTFPGVAAVYLDAFARNQYFTDGNKRTGAASCMVFLRINGYDVTCSDDEVYRMTKLVAKGHLSREGVIEWVRDCIVSAQN